ncbi:MULTISPECIES: hypothetical protein [Micromonospora]|uniref:hypothetical protein n=1 Tax=Micromonospora TaxID=1873 RepID=UPI000C888CCD|nr:hypothetical protein [Verrucosispora sp. ts21]PMR61979.1 hypothetical protein C1A38_05605 [Verrucosispora sp. ts21]
MPSLAFSRPLWSVTRCPLADLTRLALTALILAVGLGGVTAAGLPDGTADLPAAPPAAAVSSRSGDMTAPAFRPGNNESAQRVEPARTRPGNDESTLNSSRNESALPSSWNESALVSPVSAVHAAAAVPHSERTDAGAVAPVSTRPAAVRLAAGPGEPTRRGPPTA